MEGPKRGVPSATSRMEGPERGVPSSLVPSLGLSAFQTTAPTPSSAAPRQVVSLMVRSFQGERPALRELATLQKEGRVTRLGPASVPHLLCDLNQPLSSRCTTAVMPCARLGEAQKQKCAYSTSPPLPASPLSSPPLFLPLPSSPSSPLSSPPFFPPSPPPSSIQVVVLQPELHLGPQRRAVTGTYLGPSPRGSQ